MAQKKAVSPVSNWDLLVASFKKEFADETSPAFFKLGDMINALDVEVIPTGLASLDEALGVFGFPRGRIIEIYGPESSGKTTLALLAVAKAQSLFPDRPVLYVDLEHALDKHWMDAIGVNTSELWISQPKSAEKALQSIVTATETGSPSVIVLDSVASLCPQAELDGDIEDQQMGVVARLVSKFCRKVTPHLRNNGTTLICINQIRSKIGPYGGETRPGGNALKFFATQVIKIRKSGDIAQDGMPVGVEITCEVKKNKVAAPFRTAIVSLLFDSGFSCELALLDCAAGLGVVDKSGSWYSYNGAKLGQGKFNSAMFLKQNQGISDEIYAKCKSSKSSKPAVVVTLSDPEADPDEEPDV